MSVEGYGTQSLLYSKRAGRVLTAVEERTLDERSASRRRTGRFAAGHLQLLLLLLLRSPFALFCSALACTRTETPREV